MKQLKYIKTGNFVRIDKRTYQLNCKYTNQTGKVATLRPVDGIDNYLRIEQQTTKAEDLGICIQINGQTIMRTNKKQNPFNA